MKNFKPGQKVIYTGKTAINKAVRYPKFRTEIVTIDKEDPDEPGYYVLVGYEKSASGRNQIFHYENLEPIPEQESPFPSLTFKEVVKEQAPLTCLN